MVVIVVGHFDWRLGAVAGRLHSKHFVPGGVVGTRFHRTAEVAPAVTVHRAVQIDRRNSATMSFQDAIDVGPFGYRRGAFIMQHHVVGVGPILRLVNFKPGVGTLAGVKHYRYFRVNSLFNAFLEQPSLSGVIVTAAAGDQEDFQRLGRTVIFSSKQGRTQADQDQKCEAVIHRGLIRLGKGYGQREVDDSLTGPP